MQRPRVSALSFALLSVTTLPAQIDESLLAGMKARSIGPAGMSGRVVAIDAVHKDPNVVYVGAATGGLWKTTNGGLTFQPIFDDQPVASIGAVCIFQASPDIVWVGTGEGNPRNSVSLGNGVYKSIDGGRTWQHLGLENTERIRRIWVHPDDPDVCYVAALGSAWRDNPERGLFKTTDGGETWQNILHVDEKTACIDIEVDPRNPRKMFASMWDHRRQPWTFRSGGPGSGLYRSVDGGSSWTELGPEDGLPKGTLGRIKAAFAPSNSNIVYVLCEAKKNVLLRSDDGGFKFRTINKEDNVAPRPFYYCDLRIDPQNPDRIYNLHSTITLSTDGGKSFRQLVGYAQAHPDHHTMWINPNDPRHIIEGNDGGVAISRDHGKTWDFVTQLPLAQFYHIDFDMNQPYNVYGGMQDNGSWRGPGTVWENGGIRNQHWDEVCFGDGFRTLPDPEDSMQGYAMSQEGNLVRWNLRTGQRKGIKPIGPDGVELRFNWNAGLAQDPFDNATIYYGSQFVHRSNDRGESWSIISPDLTTNHAQWQKQADSGGLTLDVTGAENFTTIVTITPSPVSRRVIWVGTDDGRVHVTKTTGESWESLEANIPDLPRNSWCPHIEASEYDAAVAFAVFDDHRRGNNKPYVYKTVDHGKTWTSLVRPNIRGYCLAIEQDPVDADVLFLGTEFGLWFTTDGGQNWNQFKHGLPTCSVMSVKVHPREHDLILGTHGRAAFVIDDVWPLRSLTQETLAEPLHLFPVPPAVQFQVKQTGGSRFPGQGEFRGAVRPRGALITFSANVRGLKHPDPKVEKMRKSGSTVAMPVPPTNDTNRGANGAADDKPPSSRNRQKDKKLTPGKAKIEILDKDDKVIRSFERDVHLGVNRVVWDMSRDGQPRPSRPGQRQRPRRGNPRGRQVLPGTYAVRVSIPDGKSSHVARSMVEVKGDPRQSVSMADRMAKDALAVEGEKLLARTAKVTKRMQSVKQEVDAIAAKLARMKASKRPKKLQSATKAAQQALKDFETKIWGKSGQQGIVRRRGYGSKIFRATRFGGPQAPTEVERTNLARARKVVDDMVAEFNKILEGPITTFNEELLSVELTFEADTREIK